MGLSLIKNTNFKTVDVVTSFYFFINYDIIIPITKASLIDQKDDFIKEYGIWDEKYESKVSSDIPYSINYKFNIDNISFRLKYNEGEYFIKNLADLAWVKVNWDLFTEDYLNYSITFETVKKIYLKINGKQELDVNDLDLYNRFLKGYQNIKTKGEMNKINSYVIN